MRGSSLQKFSLVMVAVASLASGQTAPQGQRVIGVVTEHGANGAKLRTDSGETYSVVFSADTKFQKIAPGETTLKNAQTIAGSDLADGDRILARGAASAADPKALTAQSVVVMSKSDLAEKQQKERMEWQRHGISGAVTAVDSAKKEITIRLPALANQQAVVVALKDNAPLRRYTQDSVRFADAKPAAVSDVKPGDQLRARGEKSEDGARFTADEIVTGTFQTVAGTVVAVNPETQELQMKDLGTGKPITVKLTADSALKRLPNFGGFGGPGGGPGGTPGGGGPGGPAAGGDGAPRGPRPGGVGSSPGAGETSQRGSPSDGGPRPGGGMGGRMPDIHQMMERLPQSTLAEVKPGEMIIVASTKGATPDRVTAITMLSNADRLVAMRTAAAGRAGGGGASSAAGPGGNWNLGDMSMMTIP